MVVQHVGGGTVSQGVAQAPYRRVVLAATTDAGLESRPGDPVLVHGIHQGDRVPSGESVLGRHDQLRRIVMQAELRIEVHQGFASIQRDLRLQLYSLIGVVVSAVGAVAAVGQLT